jgi:tripartite-type tricarboxylate transporter receptor subunit TctC
MKSLRARAAAAALMLMPACAYAQSPTFPASPITMVVPYAAGGPTDIVARLTAETMGRLLDQRIVVENVAGAGGTVGMARVAKAEPSGYTLLLNHIGMATSITLFPKSAGNPLSDFEPIGLIVDAPMTLVGKGSLPANTLSELVTYVKANKDKITYANAGPGTASYLCGMLFMSAIGQNLTAVSYRGTGPAMTDLVGGQVDLMCDQTTNTTSYINAGSIKAYVATRAQRLPTLPQVPSAKEAGMDGLDLSIWHGVYAPKGTPTPIIEKLRVALDKALDDPVLLERFTTLGGIVVGKPDRTPDGLRAKLQSEIERWRQVLKASAN